MGIVFFQLGNGFGIARLGIDILSSFEIESDTARRDAAIINECEDINDRSTARIERIENIVRRVEEQNKEVGTQTSSHT